MRRRTAQHIQKHFGLSQRKACRFLAVARSTARYIINESKDDSLLELMKSVVSKYPKAGCQMIYLVLRKTGLKINHKRVERVYSANKMQLKNRKTKKKFIVKKREEHLLSEKPGKWLAIDFVIDSVGNKRQLKMLTVIDPVTNESPVIQPAFSMRGEQVVEVLDKACSQTEYPEFIQCDNGPEFRSGELARWCEKHHIKQVFSRPGKPTDNCFIESFNGTFRNECLNIYYFENLSEAKRIIENWRLDYNQNRPQKRLKGLTPSEYRNIISAENLT